MLAELVALLGPKVLAAAGGVAAFVLSAIALYYKGRSTGASRERDRQARAGLDAVKEHKDVEEAVSRLPDGARRRELSEWSRS
ncbi:MAG: hypothetical protein ACJ8AD_14825 [Gemmatimonadaceae bacterium]